MAGLDDGKISNRQYMKLADAISGPNMESIAQGYLDIDPDVIASIKHENLNKVNQSNVELLRRWAKKNDGPQQRKVRILCDYFLPLFPFEFEILSTTCILQEVQ